MTPDAERMLAAGEGQRPYGRLTARLCVALDAFIADTAGGDPHRAAVALAQLGMARTAAILGVTEAPEVAMPWDHIDLLGRGPSRE